MQKIGSIPSLCVLWAISRIALVKLIMFDLRPTGDVNYYYVGIFGLSPGALQEYPAVGVWPIKALSWITGSEHAVFVVGFAVLCLLFDALFFGALLTVNQERFPGSRFAAVVWIIFGLATQHVFLLRLDIMCGVAVGLAALCYFVNPHRASALIAIATMMKLWPGILAAGLVGGFRSMSSWIRLAVFFTTSAVLVVIVYFVDGFDRLVSPLAYQTDRGIQIESIPGTWFMYKALGDPEHYSVYYATSKSFEVTGPNIETALMISSWAMLATVVFGVLWAFVNFLFDRWNPEATLAWSIVMVLLVICTNKVLSPQYVLWIAPLIVVAVAVRPRSWAVRLLAIMSIFIAFFSWVVYPARYDDIISVPFDTSLTVYVLIARNLLYLVSLFVAFGWWVSSVSNYSVTKSLPTTKPVIRLFNTTTNPMTVKNLGT